MKTRTAGLILIEIFLFLATIMLFIAAFTLLFKGTALDNVWSVNPKGYAQIIPYKEFAGIGFLVLSIPMLLAAIGWHLKKKWGWILAVCIFSANGLGDVVRIFTGEYIEGLFGLAVAGLLVYYLTRNSVKKHFVKY